MRTQSILVAVLAAAAFQATASAGVIIFDNSSGGDQGITSTSEPQLGDEVTAAPGTPRAVTELDIGFTSQGVAATADLQAFLYANDGSDGSPGTLLWQSAVMSGVNINSTNLLIPFNVPSVVVPDTFTFTAAITNASTTVYFVPAGGDVTGTFDQTWFGSPGTFDSLPPEFEVEARISTTALPPESGGEAPISPAAPPPAVPEPSTLALFAIGGLGVAGRQRWRRRKAA